MPEKVIVLSMLVPAKVDARRLADEVAARIERETACFNVSVDSVHDRRKIV